ncbi:MAG: TRAM domain-containing protein, partial [Deltaproteobacteria bacterium]
TGQRAGFEAEFRSELPEVAITTDVIVGFPGEDEKDFGATVELVKKIRFDGMFSFCFSPRKDTRASTLPDAVSKEVAVRRLRELQALQKAITRERLKELEGKKVEVLTEGVSKNSEEELTGRTRTNKIVNFKAPRTLVSELVEVEIVKGCANSLRGAETDTQGGR